MVTWARYLLIVSLTAVLLAGPVISAPSLPRSCQGSESGDAVMACEVHAHACCSACSGGEKSCCQHGPAAPEGSDADAGCGSCPLGQCECCQAARGLTVVCVLSPAVAATTRGLTAPLVTTDARLFSRSDEPLLPPPIA